MTRILWVTAEEPNRALGGGNIREAHLLMSLASRMETHLLLAGKLRDQELRSMLANVVEVPRVTPRQPLGKTHRRLRDVWRAGFASGPIEEVEQRRWVKSLQAQARDGSSFDLVHVEHTPLARLIPSPRRGKWTLTMQQLASRRAAQQLPFAPASRHRWAIRAEVKKAAALEQWACSKYDAVFVPSAEDAAGLPCPAIVVPNGVDTRSIRFTRVPASKSVVFLGTLNYHPNVDGLRWFADEVWPAVRAAMPDAKLSIVGREAHDLVRQLAARPGIELHEDVPSTAPYLDEARVSIVPLRVGSGTRLKALEAMAAGRPVVGTTLGLEGLGIVDGQHAQVRDDSRAMSEAIVQLLRDDEGARRLAENARQHVEAHYDWDDIAPKFADTIERLAGGRTP